MGISLLVVDDEQGCHELVELALGPWRKGERKIVHAYRPAEALKEAEGRAFQLGLVDLHYGQEEPEGFLLLKRLKQMDPQMELIVVSSAGDFKSVQEAMRAGASDYVAKGFGREELLHALERALERRRWRSMERRLASGPGSSFALAGGSPAMERLKDDLRRLAPKAVPVLLEGETGSGKEMAARALHFWGPDPASAFVAVNCAAVPASTADSFFFGHERGAFTGADQPRAGVFEEADGGTLFLDEINSLSPDLQGRLLRVLQEKEVRRLGGQRDRNVDFRLITATNKELSLLVREGSFREDLFYRINVLSLRIPPLRERPEDLPVLAAHFLPEREFDPVLLETLGSHSWPGNVRELKNLLQAMDALAEPGEALSLQHIPEHALRNLAPVEEESSRQAFERSQEERELEFLGRAYRSCGGNVSRMARMLGSDRSHLHQKLVRLGIHKAKG